MRWEIPQATELPLRHGDHAVYRQALSRGPGALGPSAL